MQRKVQAPLPPKDHRPSDYKQDDAVNYADDESTFQAFISFNYTGI